MYRKVRCCYPRLKFLTQTVILRKSYQFSQLFVPGIFFLFLFKFYFSKVYNFFFQITFYTEPQCKDRDECQLGTHKCENRTHTCINKPGSYVVSLQLNAILTHPVLTHIFSGKSASKVFEKVPF